MTSLIQLLRIRNICNNMKSILITGGTGLIGSGLVDSIDKSTYKVYVLTRKNLTMKMELNISTGILINQF